MEKSYGAFRKIPLTGETDRRDKYGLPNYRH